MSSGVDRSAAATILMMGNFLDIYVFLNSFPSGQNGRLFAGDILICIFVNEKFCILVKISLKFVPKGGVDYTKRDTYSVYLLKIIQNAEF